MKVLVLILITIALSVVNSQVRVDKGDENPKIFISCDICDENFNKDKLPFINFVRDRAEADIFIQVLLTGTSGGGRLYTLDFTGEKRFANMYDTLFFNTDATFSSDDRRNKILKYLKLGLVRFLAKTNLSENLTIDFDHADTTSTEKEDSWDNWVFSLGLNGYFNGETSYKSINGWGEISAERVTQDNRLELSLSNSYDQSSYMIEGDNLISISRSYYSSVSFTTAIDDHWSLGLWGNGNSSIYSNMEISGSVGPGIEYNIFPYTDYTRRQLRIDLKLFSIYNKYRGTTIYFKKKDFLIEPNLSTTFSYIMPWGSFSLNLTGEAYIHDLKKNRLSCYMSTSVNLFKGLSMNFYISVASIHNLINLSLAGSTLEEILLRRKQIETNYSYWGSFGISYTFGSIYQNIVNPRFGG